MRAKLPPLLLTFVLALLMGLSAMALPSPFFSDLLPSSLSLGIAVVLSVAGLLFSLLGVRSFRRKQTTVNPSQLQSSTALVTSGIYRFSRNPMYLGFVLILVGWGLYLGNLLLLIVCVAGFVLYLSHFQIMPEERALQERFGDVFLAYCHKVRRWL